VSLSAKIYEHLVRNNILCREHHGFIAGRSTCTNILECLNDWTCNLQDGFATDVICIDFSEAFDVIQHDKLFVKLRSHGTDGILLQWIINLFTKRLFCTRIDDLLSSFVTLISGVIQGSVIGPLMFLIYINDLATLLRQYNVKVKLFTNDVKLYVRVVSNADVTELQMALSAVTSWADY